MMSVSEVLGEGGVPTARIGVSGVRGVQRVPVGDLTSEIVSGRISPILG